MLLLFLLLLEIGVDHLHRPAAILGLGGYTDLEHLDEALAVVCVLQGQVDEVVGRDVGKSWVFFVQCAPCCHVAVGFVCCLMQYEEAQLWVSLGLLLNKLGVVDDVPAVSRRRGYIVPHSDFATGQYT